MYSIYSYVIILIKKYQTNRTVFLSVPYLRYGRDGADNRTIKLPLAMLGHHQLRLPTS